jgi:hypothetical protein
MILETIPDTTGYMIAGYAIALIIMGLYVFSMYVRTNNLKRDAQTLESLQTKPKAKSTKKK